MMTKVLSGLLLCLALCAAAAALVESEREGALAEAARQAAMAGLHELAIAAAGRAEGRNGGTCSPPCVRESGRVNALASLAAVYARAGEAQTAAEYFERAAAGDPPARVSGGRPASNADSPRGEVRGGRHEAGPAARKTLRRLVRDIEDEND